MKITTYLKKKNLSQRDFCKLLGLSHNAVYNYMKGNNKASLEVINKAKRIMSAKSIEWK